MDKNIFEKLKSYIIELNYINSNKITKDTEVEKDLGVTGDDAYDFIEEFSSSFNVDISNFDYSKYFRGEGICLDWALGSTEKNPYDRKKITLEDLVNAIEKGKLE